MIKGKRRLRENQLIHRDVLLKRKIYMNNLARGNANLCSNFVKTGYIVFPFHLCWLITNPSEINIANCEPVVAPCFQLLFIQLDFN